VKVLSSNSSSEKKERKKLDSHILAWGWSWISILLPTASQVAETTDMHHHAQLLFIYLFCGTGIWTQGLHLEPLHQTISVVGFFWDGGVSWTICLGWFQTSILLISASWVAGITGMRHWCPDTPCSTYYGCLSSFLFMTFPISTSRVAGITGVSQYAWAITLFWFKYLCTCDILDTVPDRCWGYDKLQAHKCHVWYFKSGQLLLDVELKVHLIWLSSWLFIIQTLIYSKSLSVLLFSC
jgi:hypothetical protein